MSRRIFLLMLLVSARVVAQEPLADPAPLVADKAVAVAPGERMLDAGSAKRALEAGFPSVAAELYRGLLERPELSAAERGEFALGLVTALLERGDIAAAEQTLGKFPGEKGAAYHLRAGLVAAAQARYDVVKSELATIKPETLVAEDRGWYYFLQGRLADGNRDFNKARDAYRQASDAAVSELARARFELARERARLFLGEVTPEQAEQQRQLMDRYGGTAAGYAATSQYAVALQALGRKDEAVALLRLALQTVPASEAAATDEFRLLLGLIAGAKEGEAGRKALENLLEKGADREKQRVALQLLAEASADGTARTEFRAMLDRLIGAKQDHPVLEDLLLVRAQFALDDKAYAQAEADAKTLLAKFPGSELKPAALGVLVSTAWEERQRYRTAADYAQQARAASPAGEARARLGVLIAEAYFRAQDYRSAAEAYGTALEDVPAGVKPGDLMFQRVLSEIEAARLDEAEKLLDGYAGDGRFDVVNRWQAEWNLAKALQVAGQTAAAFARVNRLLEKTQPAGSGLTPELKVRMAWLQARLSFDAGAAEQTLVLTDQLLKSLEAEKITEPLRGDVGSTTRLLQAQANFRLEKTDTALAELTALRKDAPGTNAAIYSYIIEANYYADKNRLVDAQRLLIKLADDYKGSRYAPYALYQAALNAAKRGQDAYYQEAYTLLERLVREYPDDDLVFYARLQQGELLRKLNQFGQAQQIYELLRNRYPQHQDELSAELALAACHRAQAATDASHIESAQAIFERLQDLPSAPVDLRVEAGFQLGDLWVQKKNLERAQAVWWGLVDRYLGDGKEAGKLGARGRFWMARVLAQLGTTLEQQGASDEAKRAWRLIVDSGLPGADYAKNKLESGVVAP